MKKRAYGLKQERSGLNKNARNHRRVRVIIRACEVTGADNANDKGEHGFIINFRESVRRPATSINDLDIADSPSRNQS